MPQQVFPHQKFKNLKLDNTRKEHSNTDSGLNNTNGIISVELKQSDINN